VVGRRSVGSGLRGRICILGRCVAIKRNGMVDSADLSIWRPLSRRREPWRTGRRRRGRLTAS
jgi:hypothetical protein